MISFIRGKVYAYDTESVIVDNNGIGYQIFYLHSLPLVLGEEVFLFTYQQFLDDAQNLYGFGTQDELDLFKRLITVKGLGPKTAMKLLNASSYQQIISAIEKADADYLRHLPGIGKATASQIVLDLKGKLVHPENIEALEDTELKDALEALKALGYRSSEIQAVIKPLQQSGLSNSDDYLKLGLQLMRGSK